MNTSNSHRVSVELAPTTLIFISELVLIALKIMNYIQVSWLIILIPIIVVIAWTTLMLLFTLLMSLKNYLF
jgi:hypothetical protein